MAMTDITEEQMNAGWMKLVETNLMFQQQIAERDEQLKQRDAVIAERDATIKELREQKAPADDKKLKAV